MKKEASCHLLYSDTDSFIYKVQTGNFYDDLSKNPNLIAHFDLSNLPKNHPLYDRSNEKFVLKFKDEIVGAPIEEFCALKPKLYSLIAGGIEKCLLRAPRNLPSQNSTMSCSKNPRNR